MPVFPSQCWDNNSYMNIYIIMGVQGCGKGAQAKLLKEALDLVRISLRATNCAFETGPDTVRDISSCKAPRNGGGSCFRVQGVREFAYGIRQELSQCVTLSRAASCSVA